MTDQELKDLVASLAVESKKTDERIEKMDIKADKRMQEFDERMEKIEIKADKRMQELDERMEKMDIKADKRMQEFDERMEKIEIKADKRMQEFDERMEKIEIKADKRMQEFDERMKKREIKEDKRIKELNERMEKRYIKADKRMKKLEIQQEKSNKKWDGFLGNYGEVAEEYFYRSLKKDKTLGKLKFDEIERNIQKRGNSVEFDIILINGNTIAIIEVKNKFHPKDIKPIIEKKIKHLKIDYPKYENYTYYFGIASMITNEEIINQAKSEGIFLLTQNANHLEIVCEGVNSF